MDCEDRPSTQLVFPFLGRLRDVTSTIIRWTFDESCAAGYYRPIQMVSARCYGAVPLRCFNSCSAPVGPDGIAYYRLPRDTVRPGLRLLEPRDIPSARVLLNTYQSRFTFGRIWMTDAEFAHTFLPRDGVVSTWVMASDLDGACTNVTEFISFYTVPFVKNRGDSIEEDDSEMRAAFAYYSAVSPGLPTVPSTWRLDPDVPHIHYDTIRLLDLFTDAFLIARDRYGAHIFNVPDCQHNIELVEPMRLNPVLHSGPLHMYYFNQRVPKGISATDIGYVCI